MSRAVRFQRNYLLPIAAIFGIVGILLLLHSSAATTTRGLEAELGQTAGAAKTTTGDSAASANGYATVNTGTTGGGGLNPIPDTLPNGNWYNISGNTFETVQLKLTGGTTTTYHVTNIQTYKGGARDTVTAGGIVSFIDTATGKDYVKSPSGPSGVLLTHFENGYAYDNDGGSFGGTSATGNCVTSNYKTYNITGCKTHNVIRIKANNFGSLAEEDKFYVPGSNANMTFSIVNTTKDISGQANLVQYWNDADNCGAAATGWDAGNSLTGFCAVQTLGGNMSTVFYKGHIIAGYYDKSTGQGMGMIWTQGYGDFFGESTPLKAWNPTFPADNFMSWEYLNDSAPQTKYFWTLHNGRSELESTGKAIIDGQYF